MNGGMLRGAAHSAYPRSPETISPRPFPRHGGPALPSALAPEPVWALTAPTPARCGGWSNLVFEADGQTGSRRRPGMGARHPAALRRAVAAAVPLPSLAGGGVSDETLAGSGPLGLHRLRRHPAAGQRDIGDLWRRATARAATIDLSGRDAPRSAATG